jgi:hypothetical protein
LPPKRQAVHFELVLKVVSPSEEGATGFLRPRDPRVTRSRRIRTAEFSKTVAVAAGA